MPYARRRSYESIQELIHGWSRSDSEPLRLRVDFVITSGGLNNYGKYVSPSHHELIQQVEIHKCLPSFCLEASGSSSSCVFRPLVLRLSLPQKRSKKRTGHGTRHNPSTQSVLATYFTPSTKFSINLVMEPPPPFGCVEIIGMFLCPSYLIMAECNYVVAMNTSA
jgi:hypothetical protein